MSPHSNICSMLVTTPNCWACWAYQLLQSIMRLFCPRSVSYFVCASFSHATSSVWRPSGGTNEFWCFCWHAYTHAILSQNNPQTRDALWTNKGRAKPTYYFYVRNYEYRFFFLVSSAPIDEFAWYKWGTHSKRLWCWLDQASSYSHERIRKFGVEFPDERPLLYHINYRWADEKNCQVKGRALCH